MDKQYQSKQEVLTEICNIVKTDNPKYIRITCFNPRTNLIPEEVYDVVEFNVNDGCGYLGIFAKAGNFRAHVRQTILDWVYLNKLMTVEGIE